MALVSWRAPSPQPWCWNERGRPDAAAPPERRPSRRWLRRSRLSTTPARSTSSSSVLPDRARLRQTGRPTKAGRSKASWRCSAAPAQPRGMGAFSEQRSDRYTRNVAPSTSACGAVRLGRGQASKIDHAGSRASSSCYLAPRGAEKYAPRWLDGTWRRLWPEAVERPSDVHGRSRGRTMLEPERRPSVATSRAGIRRVWYISWLISVTWADGVAMGVPSDEATLDQRKLSLAALGDSLNGATDDTSA